jgi:4-hydroxy-tetrahydrodipicolinate synthase
MAAQSGADAALVVVPYYNKPNPAGMKAHFETVAAAVPDQPVIMYNIPSRVIVNMSPALLAELAQVDNIVAVKQANYDELGPIDGPDLRWQRLTLLARARPGGARWHLPLPRGRRARCGMWTPRDP